MRYLAVILTLVFALAACQVTPEPTPVVEAPVEEPAPRPDPPFLPIADLTCPVVGTVTPPSFVGQPTVVTVRTASPCAEGSVVPVAWREQLTYRRHDGPDSYRVILEGILHRGQTLTFAIPYERRSDRFEVVDLRLGADSGAVILAVQNGRERQPW
jgi:hypothetical protein